MKGLIGHFNAPAIDRHAYHPNPKTVHKYRDGDGGQKQHGALPNRHLKKIGRQKSQAEKRIKVPQTAAGFDHLQLVIAEINDVALEIDWNLKHPDEERAQLR